MRYVYNYDLPNVPDNYVHRIGRTARAGRDGTAVAYCAPEEMSELRAIQKVMGRDIHVAGGEAWEGVRKPAKGGGRGGPRGGGGGKPGGFKQGGFKQGAQKHGGGRPEGAKQRRPRRSGARSSNAA